jgi:hypothetical protein
MALSAAGWLLAFVLVIHFGARAFGRRRCDVGGWRRAQPAPLYPRCSLRRARYLARYRSLVAVDGDQRHARRDAERNRHRCGAVVLDRCNLLLTPRLIALLSAYLSLTQLATLAPSPTFFGDPLRRAAGRRHGWPNVATAGHR